MSKLVDAVDSGMHPSNTDAQNQTALQAAITAAASSGGGTIVIPCFDSSIGSDSGAYPMGGPVTIGNGSSAVEVTLGGSTGNVKLKHTGASDVLQVNNVASDDLDVGGVYFHDFQINFAQSVEPPAAPSAIDLLAGQDCVVERVVFSDCPRGVTFSNFLEGTVRNCVFIWSAQLTGIGVNVTGAAAANSRCNEILIEKSNFRVGASDEPNGYIAIQITQCEHTAIKTLQIAGTNQGILIAPNSQTGLDVQFTTIEDVESGTPAAGLAVIPPSPTGSTVGGLIVVGGWFYQTPKQTSYTSGGLYFDTGGGASSQLDGVKLHGVTVFNWAGYCVQFKDGQNFEIIGGTYSGTQALGGGLGCHAITGPVKKLTCIGADLSATYTGEPDVVSNPQPYALVITAGANPDQIRYDRCRMLAYTGSPVSISGSPTNLFITNCPGYNDQNTPVSASAPTSLTSAAQLGYYGPSEINFSGGTPGPANPTSYTINTKTGTKTFSVTAASVYLSSPYDEIEISNLPTNSPFTWIGK